MLDGMAPEEAKVWGISVPVSSSGRRKWPDELRSMAVQKILAGAGIRETAEEIGANKSLVALWVKNAKCSPDGPAFVEVVTPRTLPTTQPSMPVDAPRENDASCKISVGTTTIEIPQGYAPGRSGQHADDILKGFSGVLQVDGYAGYNRLLKRPTQDVALAYCWAHARRKLHDVTQSGAAPIAQDGLAQIQTLYRIEKELRGQTANQRHAARQECSKPIIDTFELWLAQSRARVSAKSPTEEALKHIAKYWEGLCRFLTDGRIELDNNAVERTIRPIALNRKNALLAGHDAGVSIGIQP